MGLKYEMHDAIVISVIARPVEDPQLGGPDTREDFFVTKVAGSTRPSLFGDNVSWEWEVEAESNWEWEVEAKSNYQLGGPDTREPTMQPAGSHNPFTAADSPELF